MINDRCGSSKVTAGGAILEQVALSGMRASWARHEKQARKQQSSMASASFYFRFLFDFIP